MEGKEFVKPECKLIGENGNIFNLMAIASKTLTLAGYRHKADEMVAKIIDESRSYEQSLQILGEYVEII